MRPLASWKSVLNSFPHTVSLFRTLDRIEQASIALKRQTFSIVSSFIRSCIEWPTVKRLRPPRQLRQTRPGGSCSLCRSFLRLLTSANIFPFAWAVGPSVRPSVRPSVALQKWIFIRKARFGKQCQFRNVKGLGKMKGKKSTTFLFLSHFLLHGKFKIFLLRKCTYILTFWQNSQWSKFPENDYPTF